MPVTWLSWSLDHALWGLDPFGFHLTNLLGHAASAAVFFLVADRLLGAGGMAGRPRLAGATVAALFWALHPLRAETVAWVTERRGVLSTLFFLVSVLAYLGAVRRSGRARRWRLLGSLAAFALALGAKSIVMTLPAVLVLLDVYPLRRLRLGVDSRLLRPVLAEKTPYLLLAAAGAAMAAVGRTALSFHPASLGERALDVAYTLWFHLWVQLWPVGLSPLYEWPVRLDLLAPRFLVSVAGVVLVTSCAVAFRRRWPGLPAAWIYHVITLGPVLGWAPLGLQLTADRYGHLASFGWAVLAGAGVSVGLAAADRGAVRRPLAGALAVVTAAWLLGLGVASAYQAAVWRDGRTLWRHAARTDPGCWRCQEALADWLSTDGQAEGAHRAYARAVVINPDALRIRRKIGHGYEAEGRLDEAAQAYRAALARAPGSVALAVDLARVLRRAGRTAEAVDVVRGALGVATDAEVRAQLPRLDAAGDEPLAVLTSILAAERLGQRTAAAARLDRLHRLDPDLARRAGLTMGGRP